MSRVTFLEIVMGYTKLSRVTFSEIITGYTNCHGLLFHGLHNLCHGLLFAKFFTIEMQAPRGSFCLHKEFMFLFKVLSSLSDQFLNVEVLLLSKFVPMFFRGKTKSRS